MTDTLANSDEIHIRATPDVKGVDKAHPAPMGKTEQAWVGQRIEAELHKRARELLPPQQRGASGRPPRGPK